MFGLFRYPGRDRRRGPRVSESIAICLVHPTVPEQWVTTIDVSCDGALIYAEIDYPLGSEVLLYQPQNPKYGVFRVIWSERSGSGWKIALERQHREPVRSWGYH